jgi:hypothetical protein
MRSVRITLGLAAIVCAFGALSAPAFAKKAEKPPLVFGKFTASYPSGKPITETETAVAKGIGEIYNLNLANGALHIEECEGAKSSGVVDSEKSEDFFQNVVFKHCYAKIAVNKGFTEELKLPKFALGLEFRSNQSAEGGQAAPSEMEIVRPSTVTIPIGKKAPCKVTIPSQSFPAKSATDPNAEYGAAFYETEKEPASIKKFPAGFQEKLDIEMEFTKVESWVKPNEHCIYAAGEEGAYDSTPETPAYGYVVYGKGTLEAEIEEITIKNGDVGFEPAPEA